MSAETHVGTAPQYHVEHLRAAGQVGPEALARVFAAPWRAVALMTLEPGTVFGDRVLGDSEAMVFITAGTGVARLEHAPVELRSGISLTLFMGERLEIHASDDEQLEFFFTEIAERS